MKEKTKEMTDAELVIRARDRFKLMQEADRDNRRDAMDDYKFINEPGYQWDSNMKTERGDRPCYEYNKVRVTAKRIINDMRANTPSGKVRPVEGGDKKVAEIREGLIRNIWNLSDADTVVDYASDYQVSAGMGAWRVKTKESDDTFDQDIVIEDIPNPFCLYADPACKDMLKIDARDWILTEKISKEEFEEQYPDAEPIDFELHEFDDHDDWESEEEVRIAEYWWKEPYEKEIWKLVDNKVIDADSDEGRLIAEQSPEAIIKRKTVKCHKIKMALISGKSILKGPVEHPGKHFPFVMIYGEYGVIDGKFTWYGIGRFAKDAQRAYNVARTAITETIAMAPQAKFLLTTEQIKGHDAKWKEAHKKNYPFLIFNADPKQPGPPTRNGGADVPIALIQDAQLASEDIKAVTGIFDPSLGASSNETSGRAIYARQQQGDVATFNYSDNRAKGVAHTWRIINDLIPHIYDTERELRVIGSDGAEDYQTVNTFVTAPDGTPVKVNDITLGKYDTTITVGPSFATKRQEAAELYQQLMQGNEMLNAVASDLIFKAMDLPYADEIADRMKVMLPPQIQKMINEEQQIPPEVEMMMNQAEQAMTMIEQQAQALQQEAQKNATDKAELEKILANIDKEKAQFDAHVAKELAKLEIKDAKVVLKGIEKDREQYVMQDAEKLEIIRQAQSEQIAGTMAQAVENIQQLAAGFNEYAVNTMNEIRQEKENKPKIVRIEQRRENGKLMAVPIYEDGSEGEAESVN